MTITDTPTYPQRAGGLEAALLILRIDLNSALSMFNDGYPDEARRYVEASQVLISNALERYGSVTPVSLTGPSVGDTRTCPDCGRPQHYTGTEYGWAHDALIDTWHCADPRKAGA